MLTPLGTRWKVLMRREVCLSTAHLHILRNPPCAPILQRRAEAQREGGIRALFLQLAGDGATREQLVSSRPASQTSLPPGGAPVHEAGPHSELSGMQVAETQAKRRILRVTLWTPGGARDPVHWAHSRLSVLSSCGLAPLAPHSGRPCCSLGTCVSTQGQGVGTGSLQAPVPFPGREKGWPSWVGESFLPRAWQAVSEGQQQWAGGCGTPPVLEDPRFLRPGSGSPVAFSCDGPVHWK